MSGEAAPAYELPLGIDGTIQVAHRLDSTLNLTYAEVAKLMVITIADYLEQMVEVNGWRDHHQSEEPATLFPGDGRPALALYWTSAICRAVRGHLAVVPPIFASCTEVISREDEEIARDLYWEVVLREAKLSVPAQMAKLNATIAHNPFIGEPHLMLAQLYYRLGLHADAVDQCTAALSKLYRLGTAWDKRRSYAAWVGFGRLLHVRATRRSAGLDSMPARLDLPPTSGGLTLVSIGELTRAMP